MGGRTTTILSVLLVLGLASQALSGGSLQSSNSFAPKVEWSCWREKLHISISSSLTPFHGLATTIGPHDSSPRCSTQGNGGTVTLLVIDWHKHGRECGVLLNKEEGRITAQLEVHQHLSVLMSHDNIYSISCRLVEERSIETTFPPTTNTLLEADGLLAVQEAAGHATTSVSSPSSTVLHEMELQVVEGQQQQDASFLFHNSTPQALWIVEFGKQYRLIGRLHPYSASSFVMHSCWASPADSSPQQQQHQKLLLVDEQGCSVDTHLLTEFNYLKDQDIAFANILSMFKFPKARTVRFECSYALCKAGSSKCRPDCKHLPSSSGTEEEDELEMVTELLGSGLGEPEEDLQTAPLVSSNYSSSGWNGSNTSSGTASVVVHVIQRREAIDSKPSTDLPPPIPNGLDAGASTPGCVAPADMMLLYKLCIGLCFLFVLGCCCNIIFCCMSRNVGWSPKNKKKQNKRLAISTTASFQHQRPFSPLTTTTSSLNPHSRNEFWIQDTGRESNEPSFYSSHYGELPMNIATDGNGRRNSLTSYASVKQRGNRLHDSVHTTHFRLSNSGSDAVSIRPYGGPGPSTSPSANSGALRSTIYGTNNSASIYHPPPNNTTFHTSLEPTFSSSSTSSSVASSMLAEEQETASNNHASPQESGAPQRTAPPPPPPPPTTTFITMTGTQPNFKARPNGEYEVVAQEDASVNGRKESYSIF